LRANIAPTVWLFCIGTLQVGLVRFVPPLQFEDQPRKTEFVPGVGVAVKITVSVIVKFAVQLAPVPQFIPTGVLTTVPVP